MIVFNEDSRQFSVVNETREYGLINGLAAGAKAMKSISSIAKSGSEAAGALGLKPEKETFWGNFNGKNKRIRQERANAHAERMARIAAGTDTRSFIKDRIKARDARKDKEMDNKQALRLRKMDSKDKNAELKSGLKSQKLDNASKRDDRRYEFKGKKLDAKSMDRQGKRDLALEGIKAKLKDNQSRRDTSLAKLKERNSTTALPWKKRI